VEHLVATLEVRRSAGEEPGQGFDVLLEAADEVIEGKPEGVELRLVPARADAEDEPPARGGLQRPGLAGELDGRPKGCAEDQGAELDPLGACGDVAQEGDRFRAAEDPPSVAMDEDVVHHPGRVVAETLGGDDVLGHLPERAGPARGELVGGDGDADLHASGPNVSGRLEFPPA